MIDYSIVNSAIHCYEREGFQYIEVPWIVSSEIINITRPITVPESIGESLVASGEQSLLSIIIKKDLKPNWYCCATPCYRPYDIQDDGLHFSQFYKVELMAYSKKDPGADILRYIIKTALTFMSGVRSGESLDIIETQDDERSGCKTLVSYDIQTKKGVELGSYGIRTLLDRRDFYWIYGTGAALPRLSWSEVNG